MSMGLLSLLTSLTKIPQFIKPKMTIAARDPTSLNSEEEYCQVHRGMVGEGHSNFRARRGNIPL